jgi:GR25 family glycosyltransferase involved in LPS biosynthesis
LTLHDKNQTAAAFASIWQPIERIYCISLRDRRDRQASAKAQFVLAGLDGRIEFFLAKRHPTDCEQGIFESHQACLKKGLDEGAGHILVIEDDVVFGKIDACRLAESIEGFIRQTVYPILFLGALIDGSRPTQIPGVRQVRYRCLTHAYLIKASLARQVSGHAWQHEPIDGLLRRCTDRHLALYPSIAFQSNSPSDNSRHQALDTIRRLCGGLRFIQLVNERYHRFRYAVIAAHLLVAGALILWILTR